MFCPKCGSVNEDGANFCKNCGYNLSTLHQPPPPVTSTPIPPPVVPPPVTTPAYQPPPPVQNIIAKSNAPDTMKIIGVIAAALLALGFFLPWMGASRDFDDFPDIMPTINGIYFIKHLFDGNPDGGVMLLLIILLVLIISIPVFAAVYAYHRLNPKPGSLKMRTLSIAMAVFIPLLALTLTMFLSDLMGGRLMGGSNTGIGLVFMMLGGVYLFGETIYLLTKKPDTAGTLPKAWGKAAIAAGITGGLHLILIEILKSGGGRRRDTEMLAVVYVLFIIVVVAIGVNAALAIHKKQDLGGRLSFERCIGLSLIYGLLTGLACYLVLTIVAPEAGNMPGGVVMISIALNTLFSFIFGALHAANSRSIQTN